MPITLEEAKAHLRVDHSDEDTLIQLYIDTADEFIGTRLGNSSFSANAAIRAAALLMVGDLYENREAVSDKPKIENPTFENLLNPYRENLGI